MCPIGKWDISMKNSKNDSGFTLVEMSITLVIVGLIVGGILGGKSLIDGAKEKKIIIDVGGLKVALATFEEKYSAKAGDFEDAEYLWPDKGTRSGDGNGFIESKAEGWSGWHHGREGFRVFEHLAHAGVLPSGSAYNRTNVYAEGPASYLKQSPYENGFYSFNAACIRGNRRSDCHKAKQNYLQIGTWQSGDYGNNSVSGVPVDVSYRIDKKLDDGKSSSGAIIGSQGGYDRSQRGNYPMRSCNASNWHQYHSSGNYKTTRADGGCLLLFEI